MVAAPHFAATSCQAHVLLMHCRPQAAGGCMQVRSNAVRQLVSSRLWNDQCLLCRLLQETTAAKRFGIKSFVYARRRPFHPQRSALQLCRCGVLLKKAWYCLQHGPSTRCGARTPLANGLHATRHQQRCRALCDWSPAPLAKVRCSCSPRLALACLPPQAEGPGAQVDACAALAQTRAVGLWP